MLGPLGAGAQVVPDDIFRDADRGGLDLLGEDDVGIVRGTERRYLPIPLLYKDFRLHWRDLDANYQGCMPFDDRRRPPPRSWPAPRTRSSSTATIASATRACSTWPDAALSPSATGTGSGNAFPQRRDGNRSILTDVGFYGPLRGGGQSAALRGDEPRLREYRRAARSSRSRELASAAMTAPPPCQMDAP